MYCVLTLTILPCTPGNNWVVGFRVSDKNGKFIKDYVVQESFVMVYWLGFLTPAGWKKGSVVDPILANAIKNLMYQLKQDKLL